MRNETLVQLMADEILRSYDQSLNKAALDTGTMIGAEVVRLDFTEQLDLYGNDETPLLSSIGSSVARAIDHKWEQATRRAAGLNVNKENSAPKDPVSVVPQKLSNTCQIAKGTIGVSGSAIQEARNGIYNSALTDILAWQLEQETVGIFKDIEYSMLFGVEDATEKADGRQMMGLVGAVGSYNGFLQTNQVDADGEALDREVFENWLQVIWQSQAGRYPNRVYCSLSAKQVIDTFTANSFNLTVTPTDLGKLTAGMRVGYYEAPWGGLIDIYPHPLCLGAEDAEYNWMIAVREDLLKRADLRALATYPLPRLTDGENREIVWEGTLECRVEPAHGLLVNFVMPVVSGS